MFSCLFPQITENLMHLNKSIGRKTQVKGTLFLQSCKNRFVSSQLLSKEVHYEDSILFLYDLKDINSDRRKVLAKFNKLGVKDV